MASGRVTKCVCHNRTFEEIKAYACENEIISVETLRKKGYCSTNCGLCIPYIKMVLSTGRTKFYVGESLETNHPG